MPNTEGSLFAHGIQVVHIVQRKTEVDRNIYSICILLSGYITVSKRVVYVIGTANGRYWAE